MPPKRLRDQVAKMGEVVANDAWFSPRGSAGEQWYGYSKKRLVSVTLFTGKACIEVLKQHKYLEIPHPESDDETKVTIKFTLPERKS